MHPATKWSDKNSKEKKLNKLISSKSESEDESEHELSYYINDRIKLMKEVLKIIKPKKIRSMAPQCMKNMDNEEINSMLLEELLGISNKRLKYIFNGQNLEEDSSSTDPEEEQKPIDVISLDDISDDALEDVIDLDSDRESKRKHCRKHRRKIKQEPKTTKVKKEKEGKSNPNKKDEQFDNPVNEQNLMSVLELLELQARARAIRSQLALESSRKLEEEKKKAENEKCLNNGNEDDNDDDVIIEDQKNDEIVISSSDSENEAEKGNNGDNFWKRQQSKNGSHYRNTDSYNAENVLNEKSSSTDKSNHSRRNRQDKEGAQELVIIQQVEIIKPGGSDKNICDIPLPSVDCCSSSKIVPAEDTSSQQDKKLDRTHDESSASAEVKNTTSGIKNTKDTKNSISQPCGEGQTKENENAESQKTVENTDNKDTIAKGNDNLVENVRNDKIKNEVETNPIDDVPRKPKMRCKHGKKHSSKKHVVEVNDGDESRSSKFDVTNEEDSEKNNTDDGDGIELHMNHADMDCINP